MASPYAQAAGPAPQELGLQIIGQETDPTASTSRLATFGQNVMNFIGTPQGRIATGAATFVAALSPAVVNSYASEPPQTVHPEPTYRDYSAPEARNAVRKLTRSCVEESTLQVNQAMGQKAELQKSNRYGSLVVSNVTKADGETYQRFSWKVAPRYRKKFKMSGMYGLRTDSGLVIPEKPTKLTKIGGHFDDPIAQGKGPIIGLYSVCLKSKK